MIDIAERLHHLMLRPGFQAREDQETLWEGKREIERLREVLISVRSEVNLSKSPKLMAKIEAALGIIAAGQT